MAADRGKGGVGRVGIRVCVGFGKGGVLAGQHQRVQATREARLYSEAALEAEQKKLENGKSTSFVVLQLQKDLTTARSSEIRALADYNESLAQLWLQEGSTLERRMITLRSK